jgi:hypothetical protein
MKTSLDIPEALRQEAKIYAAKTGKGIGEVIVYWASLGKEVAKTARAQRTKRRFKPLDLGEPLIDVTSRSAVYDALDERDDWLR